MNEETPPPEVEEGEVEIVPVGPDGGPLPAGWERKIDTRTGRPYYEK